MKNCLLLSLVLCVVLFHQGLFLEKACAHQRVYFGGKMMKLNNTLVNNVGYYDLASKKINPLGDGTNGEVKVVKVDSYGNVYIGGNFTQVGLLNTGPLAMWNITTSTWTSLSLNSSQFSVGSSVEALDVDCSSSSSCDLFVGGRFNASLDSGIANNFIYYDSSSSKWLKTDLKSDKVSVVVLVSDLQTVAIAGDLYEGNNVMRLGVFNITRKEWWFSNVSLIGDMTYNKDYNQNSLIVVSPDVVKQTSSCIGYCAFNLQNKTWFNSFNTNMYYRPEAITKKVKIMRGYSTVNNDQFFMTVVGSQVYNYESICYATDFNTGSIALDNPLKPTGTVLALDTISRASYDFGGLVVGGENQFKIFNNDKYTWSDVLSVSDSFVINSLVVNFFQNGLRVCGPLKYGTYCEKTIVWNSKYSFNPNVATLSPVGSDSSPYKVQYQYQNKIYTSTVLSITNPFSDTRYSYLDQPVTLSIFDTKDNLIYTNTTNISMIVPTSSLSSVDYTSATSFKLKPSVSFLDQYTVCKIGIIDGMYTSLQALSKSSNYTFKTIPCDSYSTVSAPYYGYPYTKFLFSYENSLYMNISQSIFRQQKEYYGYFPTFTAALGNVTQGSVVYTNNTLSFSSNITTNIPTLECRADVVIDNSSTSVYVANCTNMLKFSVSLIPEYFKNTLASLVITLRNKDYYFEDVERFDFVLSPCTLNCQNGGLCKKQADGYSYCDCVSPYTGDKCQLCKSGYTLQNGSCIANQTSTCYGKNSTDSTVCSSHGSCGSNGLCKCYPGYSGNDCSIPVCFSVNADNFGVCNGNGKCVAPDTCSCDSLFSGMECETPTCNGKTELEGACSFHGTCNSFTHLCECKGNFAGASCSSCKSDFTGSNCDVPICNGISSIDKYVCNGKGSCQSSNNSSPACVCSDGYYGINCGNFRCNGVEKSNSSVCSSNGVCSLPNTCSCKGNYDPASFCSKCLPSYSGSDCTVPICESSTTCSGKGQCNANLQCVCSGNFAGTYCDKCKDGWVGSNCNYQCSASTTCSGRGSCSEIGECICSGNTNGKNCESCKSGWYGDKCDFSINVNSFEFNENGDSIIATVYSGVKKKISCSSLIVNTQVLGSEPTCLLDGEKSQLVIQLGPMASIVIGGTLNMRAYFESSSFLTATVLGTNYIAVDPTAYLTSDTSSIACGNMILDASASSSLDRRQLLFSYSPTLAPSTKDIETLSYLINTTTSSSVKFGVSQLSTGTYSVQVAVQSTFTNRVSYATFTFSVTESSPPTITIANGLSSSMTIGNSYVIRPIVSFPSCYRGTPSTASLKFTYSQTSGSSLEIKQLGELLVFSSDYTRIIDEGDYSFTLTAQETGYPQALVSFKVSASALPLKVSFNIRDMSQSLEDNIKFKISKQDPSNPTSIDGQVKLSCVDLESLATCSGFDSNALNIDQSTLTLDKQFNPGTYLFTATFTKSSRTSTSTVKVTVTSQTKATSVRVFIEAPSTSDLSAVDPSSDLILQAQSLDILSAQRNFIWSSSDLSLDSSIDTTKKYLSIPKSLLVPGASYTVSVSVVDGIKSGSASISFIVNAPPSLGVLEISPSTGVALVDEFKVSCGNGWSDSQLPLSFQFWVRETGQQLWKLLKEKSETRSFRTYMPEGQLEIKATVYDAKGAFTETISTLNVTSPTDASSALSSLNMIGTSTITVSNAGAALNVISKFKKELLSDVLKQQFSEASSTILTTYFTQMDTEQNATSQTESSTSSSFSLISSVGTCIDNLPVATVSLTIRKFRSIVQGALLKLKLPAADINSASESATTIQSYVSKNLARSILQFTTDEVKSIDEIKENLNSLQLKNSVPDMPATRTSGSNFYSYARLLSVSSLSNLNETVNDVSAFKLSNTFNSLSQISTLDNVKLVMKVQTQDKAVSKLFTFRVESSESVELGVNSTATDYIAELTIEKSPSKREILESRTYCVSLQNGVLVEVNSDTCSISSTNGNTFTIKVSSSGSFAIMSEQYVSTSPKVSVKASPSKIITNSTSNLSLLALLTLLIPVIAVIVIVVVVIACCIVKKKNSTHKQMERSYEEKSFMEMESLRQI